MTRPAPRLPARPPARLRPARLHPVDVVRVGATGLRTRPVRVVLSALGIAIGIAAMIAVVGISASSRVDLDRTLEALGTNLLTVAPGEEVQGGGPVPLPMEAVAMVDRIGPVTSVSATGAVPDARVYRTDRVPSGRTGGITVLATRLDLPATVGARVGEGVWLNPATASYPAVVLGSAAAARLAVHQAGTEVGVWLGGRWFTVIGILDPVPLAPELDAAALVGWPAAQDYLAFDGHPTMIYCRAVEAQVVAVRAVLARTVNPASPLTVQVSRPSDALAAKQATDQSFTALLLGLGGVALLVGGVGVANTMVISVLERRPEIGLRRALGATRGQIRLQFLAESLLLSAIGGLGGVALGIAVTAAYAATQGWPTYVPALATAGGAAATLVVGTVAGLYPAVRAARMAPSVALASP